jgi:glyoxylase-like metal-dependent hydrolase (beta-lactamase superfamily II)
MGVAGIARRAVSIVRALLVVLAIVPLHATAQDAASRSLRLYVLDGGTLVNPDPSWANVTLAEIKGYTSIPVPAYLVVHPQGTLLWDTGLGDRLRGLGDAELQRGPWTQVVTTTIRDQLAEIGYTPADIDFLALSHAHFDHAGNANDFAGATWIVQQAELDSVDFDNTAQWGFMSALRDSDKRVVSGDHDVFGDGTVILISTPGHTPGHQSLYIDLADTGPIVLSGDLYHLEAHRRLARIRLTDFDRAMSAASRAAIDMLLEETGAELWIQHELMLWATLTTAPAYYK